jgi:sugar (pentulose or hexulose) kinase
VLGRPLRLLPEGVSSVASARGAALLAGLASGAYSNAGETLGRAPEPGGAVHPGETAREYEESYARYERLYPRLYC